MKNLVVKLLIILIVGVSLLNLFACSCGEDYSEYPTLEHLDKVTTRVKLNENLYVNIQSGYWINNKDYDYYSVVHNLWQVSGTENRSQKIVGRTKWYFSWQPIYNHAILGDEIIFSRGVYIKEGFVFPDEKDLLISKIALHSYYSKEDDKEYFFKDGDRLLQLEMDLGITSLKEIITERKTSREDFNIEYFYWLRTYIFFTDFKEFKMHCLFFICKEKAYLELNDYVYEVKPEYATQIYNYVSEK